MANNDMSDPWDDFGDPAPEVAAPSSAEVTAQGSEELEAASAPPAPPPLPEPDEVQADPAPGLEEVVVETIDDDLLDVPELDDFANLEVPELADFDAGEVVAADMPNDLDLGFSDLEMPEVPDVPDLPAMDLSDGLEIPDLDLAGVGIGGAGVEIPEAIAAELPELDADELLADAPDDELLSAEIPDFEVDDHKEAFDDGGLAEGESPAVSAESVTRTPFSPMFAATGIFGDSPLDPISDTDESAAVEDLESNALDDDIEFGSSTPPAVYAELEELAGDPSQSGSDDTAIPNDLLEWAETEIHDDGSDQAVELPDFDTSDSDEASDDTTEFDLDVDPADADLEALAAMVADVDPIVLGEDEEPESDAIAVASDTDDWLSEEDELEASEGFDIGITLGSSSDAELSEEQVDPADVDELENVGELEIPDLNASELAGQDFQVPGFDVSGLDGAGAEASDIGMPEVDAPEVETSHAEDSGFDIPELEIPELDGSETDQPAADVPSVNLGEFDMPETLPEAAGPPLESEQPESPDIFSADLQAFTAPAVAGIEALGDSSDLDLPPDVQEVSVFDELNADGPDVIEGANAMGAQGSEGWGARWKESAQGWVEDSSGASTWRPIVTTSPLLSEWDVDTYLGVVVGDTVLEASGATGASVAESRQTSTDRMMEEALARGAHAIIGMSYTVQTIGTEVLVTASGTAVTLKADAPA